MSKASTSRPGMRGGKPFKFRNTAKSSPAWRQLLREDEKKQREKDRAWLEGIEAAIGAESSDELIGALQLLNPADCHALLRGAMLEPIDGDGYLPRASRQIADKAIAASQAAAALPAPVEAGPDESDFWEALEGFRNDTTAALEVDRILARPALRGRADLRSDFDRLLRLKGG